MQETRLEAETPRTMTEMVTPRHAHADQEQLRTLVVLGLVVLVAASVVFWLLVRGGGDGGGVQPGSGPALLTQGQLETFARSARGPVYWAGSRQGTEYEVTTTAGGRTYVRYLPAGTSAGDPRADFLIVGTYAQPHAFADLRRAAGDPGSVSFHIDHGGLVVYGSHSPTSVYIGYPGRKYQVEVYDPSGETTRALVRAGKIVPVR